MSLTLGTLLGPYEVTAHLGAGGMGEVYRARDTRLGRDVAVKVLPESFASDSERMRRFEQEARAIAALSHPNVMAVFDTGVHNGVPYIVTELLEGESLRQRLNEGPLSARKAVEFAQQMADGLAAAHEKGIVHRDLKPENLFLCHGSHIKILDFGLAKQLTPQKVAASGDGDTASFSSATNAGAVMGTAGYMAPEQVRGAAVDHRADIFSFGATLYEMLSGHRAFKGESSVETMHAILHAEPPELETEKLHIGPGLERIVSHCLEKNPGDRFQSARDLGFALGALSGTALSAPVHVPYVPRRKWLVLASLFASALLVAGLAYWAGQRPAPVERADFAIPVPGELIHVAISADGRWLAFVSPGPMGGDPMVYVQKAGASSARVIPGSEGANYPFLSPDGAYVAFFSSSKLRKAPVAGGETQSLANTVGARGGSWGSKGVIIYAPDAGGGLWRVNADGTGAAPLTEKLLTPLEASHRWPVFLPDGDHFLMFAGDFDETKENKSNGIYLSSLSKLEKRELSFAHSNPGYADGQLYYVDAGGALVAAPFDQGGARLTGEPRVISPRVGFSPSTYYGTFAVAANSTIVYSSNGSANNSQLTWLDEAGKELGRLGTPGILANPMLSPDGRYVAFDSGDLKARNVDVWILDVAQGSTSRFTFEPQEDSTPVWSRDSNTVTYRTIAPVRMILKKANGLEAGKILSSLENNSDDMMPNSWALDGKTVLGTLQAAKGGSDLVLVPAEGGKIRPFLNGPASETNGMISPDGKWVAYASNETGEWEIYVTTFPGAAGKWQVSHGGGSEPRWRADGKAIFYIGPKQMLTTVPVNTAGSFSTGAQRPLFQIHSRPPISSTDLFTYDVSRDGKRFLVNQYVKPAEIPPLSIVLNANAPAAK
jgi:Tol biopolymer transport system component